MTHRAILYRRLLRLNRLQRDLALVPDVFLECKLGSTGLVVWEAQDFVRVAIEATLNELAVSA